MKYNNNIWLLIDDRKGNTSQIYGIAKHINSKDIIEKKIFYNNLASLPNIFLCKSIPHVKNKFKKHFKPPWPKLVIGCGRRSAPIGLWIKKQSKGFSKCVQIMWPSYPHKNIDLIFTPQHDKIPKKNNVINIFSSPNIIDNELLNHEYLKWNDKFKKLPNPKIAVLLGGNTKKHVFQPFHIINLMNQIKLLLKNKKASLLITTSRRTSLECIEMLKKELKNFSNDVILWEYKNNKNNPYFGFLTHANLIIVTGDSVSQCSEAASTGKPLLIFAPEDITIKKHKEFHENLYNNNVAKKLEKFNINDIDKLKYKPINESLRIAKIINEKFL
tara:strand:- start:1740 stop:2726 length:987 start_codon:yes stop_codon:yes gene_type:complete